MGLVQAFLLAALALTTSGGAVAADAVFDSGIEGSAGASPFPHWSRLLQRARAEGDDKSLTGTFHRPRSRHAPRAAGTDPPAADCDNRCAQDRWTGFLQSIRDLPWPQQLDHVNRWVNARPYIEDWMNWGVPDYWETPAEFVRRGGDCEDFAIAKYFSLIRLGFSPGDLRIVVIKDRNLQASHAVLAVRRAGQTWLMDIAVPEVVPMALATQYTPVYAVNAQGWWLYDPARVATGGAADSSAPK